jgi:type I restriction enzyme M protein
MRHFATELGKSKGKFHTRAQVSRIMAKVLGVAEGTSPSQTIYDPTCGSGSLLLKAADEAPHGATIYGQEMDNSTWALARMNMIPDGRATAEVWKGNTLANPHFKTSDDSLKTFDPGSRRYGLAPRRLRLLWSLRWAVHLRKERRGPVASLLPPVALSRSLA